MCFCLQCAEIILKKLRLLRSARVRHTVLVYSLMSLKQRAALTWCNPEEEIILKCPRMKPARTALWSAVSHPPINGSFLYQGYSDPSSISLCVLCFKGRDIWISPDAKQYLVYIVLTVCYWAKAIIEEFQTLPFKHKMLSLHAKAKH